VTVAIPLILVVGPTAAGKSALAVGLAERLGGEVVSADAMAVYRDMDIGTAKPSPAERARVPHHGVDMIPPEEPSDVARWLGWAEAAIADIDQRGRLAVVAGGTPLYTKALLEGLSAGAPRDAQVRAALDARYTSEGPAALHAELTRIDPVYAAAHHANDQRRIVRALEVFAVTGQPFSSFHVTDGTRRASYRTLQIGVHWDRAILYQRINARSKQMFAAGLVDEVCALAPRLGNVARQAVGYKEVLDHLEGRCDLDMAIEQVKRHSRHLAKHQITWYKRFRDIHWLPGDAPDLLQQAEQLAREFLQLPYNKST